MTAGNINMKFSRPIIVASSCLEFEKVRYNGQVIPSKIINDLKPFAEFIKVCPEYEIGLGVPRDPIRIVKVDDEYRLIQHNTNRDVTQEMNDFCSKFSDNLKQVDGFIFKSKSPTMGVKNIKVYAGMKGSPVIERCGGFFAGKIVETFQGYPIEEEDRLRNKKIRDHFLTKLFLFAHYREAKKENNLDAFQEKNDLLFKFYNLELSKRLNIENSDYFDLMKQIFDKPPNADQIYNFFNEILYLIQNRDEFQKILKKYKNNKLGFHTIKEILRFDLVDKKMLNQSFFHSYPEELVMDMEDDRKRDYWK
jgi:uncharacterized protein YbbK (DUF523 family)